MIKLQTTLTLGLCILGSSALGQAQQAIDKAKAIRADFLQTQASHTGKTYAELSKIGRRVSLGKMSIILDAESLELYTYADYDTIGLSQKENLTDQDLVPKGELKATADRIVSLLPPADYADVAITRPNRESGSRHITFLYYPKPFGYSSKGFGNNTSVALDAITGNITYVSRASGWSYQEPNILVTEAEAHQIASEKSGHSEDKVSLVVLKFSLGQSGRLSERILKDKKLRLGYGFSIPNGHIIIDAETGEVLRHDTFRTPPGGTPVSPTGAIVKDKVSDEPSVPSDPDANTSTKSNSTKAVAITAGAVIIALMGFGFIKWFKKTN